MTVVFLEILFPPILNGYLADSTWQGRWATGTCLVLANHVRTSNRCHDTTIGTINMHWWSMDCHFLTIRYWNLLLDVWLVRSRVQQKTNELFVKIHRKKPGAAGRCWAGTAWSFSIGFVRNGVWSQRTCTSSSWLQEVVLFWQTTWCTMVRWSKKSKHFFFGFLGHFKGSHIR